MYQVEVSAVVDAPAALVYEILSDYEKGHPSILPPQYFTNLEVLAGGRGAGTAVKVEMTAFGSKVTYHMLVSEPEPGRVLCEEDAAAGVVTTFTVDPLSDAQSQVTIATVAQTKPGLMGWLEKVTTPLIARRIYREELAQLQRVAQKRKNESA